MIKIILINYRRKLSQNIFSILLFSSVLFTLFFFTVQLYKKDQEKILLFKSYPENACYISYALEKIENKGYQYFENEINRNSAEDIIGYELINRNYTVSGEKIVTVYINKYLRKFEYFLKSGNWFKESNSSGIIIGGDLCNKYNIGDTIIIKTDKKEDFAFYIIGKLQSKYEIMLLNVAGDELNFSSIGTENIGNIVITINRDIMTTDTTFMNKLAVVMDGSQIRSNNIISLSSKQITSFKELYLNSYKTDNISIYSNGMIILLITVTIICLLYEIYLYICNHKGVLYTLLDLGLNYFKISFVVLIPHVINAIIGFFVVFGYQRIAFYEKKSTISACSIIIAEYLLIILICMYFFSFTIIKHICRKN